MRWSRRTCAVSSLLGSTLVYAIPSPIDDRSGKRMFVERAPLDDDITMVSGFAAPVTAEAAAAPSQTQNNSGNGGGNANNPSTPVDNAAVQNPSPTAHDTLTDASNEFNDITTTSGYASELGQSGGGSILANQSESNVVTFSSSSSSSQHSSLASEPASSSGTNHGVLIGIVVGGVLLGVVALTVGLWLCYRRRGPTSGASTPRYDTATAGEKEKPSFVAFLRSGLTRGSGGKRNTKWKRGHLRVKSSQSFASPMIANDPKLMEEVARTRTRTLSMKNPPALPPHLATTGVTGGVGTSGTVTGKDRWSTFSSSDGGSVQTPVATNRLDGIIMETVVEIDGPSNPQTPIFGQRQSQYQTQNHQSSIDYLDLKRTPSDDRSPFDSATQIPPLTLGSRMSKASGSFYRDETDLSSPTTPTSSGGLTYGSNGSYGSIGRPRRTSDRYTYTQPLLTTSAMTPNVSYPTISTQHQASSTPALPLFSGANASALVAARPKFNPTHTNKSGVSVGGNSGGSGNSANETIRITNPFLGGDEDDLSSYGHGIIEADHLDHLDHLDMIKGDEDAMSINSTDTGIMAYPSSTGCLPNKPSPSPNLFANPLRSVNPALIEADAAAKAAHANAHARIAGTAAQRISSSSTQTPSYSSNSSNTYTHPRSSMISDSSSDYPYPLGYAIDHEGNVANPFLRISEILEEVDGRMRWPSPPLLPRSESPNY